MDRIVLFDGVCNFCNGTVNFIIRHDPHKIFRFAPLQSEVGDKLRRENMIDESVDSIVLVENGTAYTHSEAALRIAKALGGIWSLAYVLMLVPAFIRDAGYRFFASNRYKWFGRKDTCMIPTPEVRERFIG